MVLNGLERFASLSEEERQHLQAAFATRTVPARTSLVSEQRVQPRRHGQQFEPVPGQYSSS